MDTGKVYVRRYVQTEFRTLRALSQGLHPGSGEPLPASDPASQERLKTCFGYAGRALERTLELGYYSAEPPVPAADEPCGAKESTEDQTAAHDMFWTSFYSYLLKCHKALTAHLGDPPDLDKAQALGRMNYGEGQDYQNPLFQQFYALRYMYANGIEYYMMFCRLFDAWRLGPPKKTVFEILSLGCGNGIDLWAMGKAIVDLGLASHTGCGYTGVDRVAWGSRWGEEFLSNRSARYVQGDAVEFLEEHTALSCNTILFPHSIGEFSDEDFARLCRALSRMRFEFGREDRVFRTQNVHILASLRKAGDGISSVDENRCRQLIEAMKTNGYALEDPAAARVYTLDDGPISRYAPQKMVYPARVATYWKELQDKVDVRVMPVLTTKYFCNRVMSFVWRGWKRRSDPPTTPG